jgi:hypothetical protein
MSDPDISNDESVDFPSDFSCNNYSADSRCESPQIEIDMDSIPNIPVKKIDNTIKPLNQPVKKVITKKPIVKKETELSKEIKPQPDSPIKKEIVKKEIVKKEIVKKDKNQEDKGLKEKAQESKESVADSKFQFNEETIEYFCKDILGDFKKICIPNSQFNNDTVLLCLLIKLNIFKEYKCVEKKCKTGKTWLGQPIQLLIHRKNGKMHDLSTINLELICANCYIAKYGLDLFIKVLAKTVYKCSYCEYPLSKFTNSKKKERICMACESKIMTSGYFEQRSRFIDQLSDTIDEASTLKQDEFKSSNYYSQVSQYKTFNADDAGLKTSKKASSVSSKKTFNDKPIITLNLTVPNIEDLILEE